MSKDYTETIENTYPEYIMKHHKDHIKYLERELRKSKVKIHELQKKVNTKELESLSEAS